MVDLYPTLMELCDLEAKTQLDGTSLAPQLADPQTPRKQPVVISSFEGNHAIRSRRWRYIRYQDDSEELYDHSKDSREYTNLATEQEYASVIAELATYLPQNSASEVKPLPNRESNNEGLRRRRQTSGAVKK